MDAIRLALATGMSALMLAGCGGADGPTTAPSVPKAAASSVPAEVTPLLARYGLDGKDAVQIVDHLDRLGVQQRPADLMASVRPAALVVSRGAEKFDLKLPDDRFYLSIAPYVKQTHECFYHSLTTCKGELAGKNVQVQIVNDATGAVLVDGAQRTFDNGFIGFWLPRDIKGTLKITHEGKVGQTKIATEKDAPTCLTTVQLA